MIVCLAVLLNKVHCFICGGYYLCTVIAVFGIERNTDTCLDIDRNICKLGVIALVKLIDKVKREALDIFYLIGIGYAQNKLITAETAGKSASLYTLLDTAGNILDNLIAYRMTETVVDELEVVDIYKQYGNICISASFDFAL